VAEQRYEAELVKYEAGGLGAGGWVASAALVSASDAGRGGGGVGGVAPGASVVARRRLSFELGKRGVEPPVPESEHLVTAIDARDAGKVEQIARRLQVAPDHRAGIAGFLSSYGLSNCVDLQLSRPLRRGQSGLDVAAPAFRDRRAGLRRDVERVHDRTAQRRDPGRADVDTGTLQGDRDPAQQPDRVVPRIS